MSRAMWLSFLGFSLRKQVSCTTNRDGYTNLCCGSECSWRRYDFRQELLNSCARVIFCTCTYRARVFHQQMSKIVVESVVHVYAESSNKIFIDMPWGRWLKKCGACQRYRSITILKVNNFCSRLKLLWIKDTIDPSERCHCDCSQTR